MKRLLLLATIALSGCGATVTWRPPNRDLLQSAYDSPLTTNRDPRCATGFRECGGWTMPRAGWHLFNFAVSETMAYGLRRAGVSPGHAGLLTTAGIGFGPHVLGHVLNPKDPIDVRDWAADAWMRSTSLRLIDTSPGHWRATTVLVVGYVALYPYASPEDEGRK